jgi:hypothetical protein
MHGGASTGPRTAGRAGAVAPCSLEHEQSAAALAEQRRVRELLAQSRELLKQMLAS